MYQKLNYLASVCAGDYSDVGYMRGNLIEHYPLGVGSKNKLDL